MVNKQMSRNNNKYSLIALKIFIVIIFIFSTLFYGCRGKKAVLFWEDKYYYDIPGAKEAITNSAHNNLDNVTDISTPSLIRFGDTDVTVHVGKWRTCCRLSYIPIDWKTSAMIRLPALIKPKNDADVAVIVFHP